MISIATPTMWAVFTLFVILALLVDLLVLKANGPHKVSTKEALIWSMAWIGLAVLFNAGLWWYLKDSGNPDADRIGLEFMTGYLVEKALAVDNIFVFLMIFSYFAVPAPLQQLATICVGRGNPGELIADDIFARKDRNTGCWIQRMRI